jgi:putative flavoprotein involved in K+ transport
VHRAALERLTETGAVFRDGREEPFDAVVAATGFRTGLDALLAGPEAGAVLDAAHEPVARSGEPTAAPGIFFTGFTHSLRGHLFEASLASRRLARHVARYLASA